MGFGLVRCMQYDIFSLLRYYVKDNPAVIIEFDVMRSRVTSVTRLFRQGLTNTCSLHVLRNNIATVSVSASDGQYFPVPTFILYINISLATHRARGRPITYCDCQNNDEKLRTDRSVCTANSSGLICCGFLKLLFFGNSCSFIASE